MSASDDPPYVIPEARTKGGVSVLPTDRLVEIVAMFHVMEEALITIASAFGRECDDPACEFCGSEIRCRHCGMAPDRDCNAHCPGLLARRALGVA